MRWEEKKFLGRERVESRCGGVRHEKNDGRDRSFRVCGRNEILSSKYTQLLFNTLHFSALYTVDYSISLNTAPFKTSCKMPIICVNENSYKLILDLY